MNGKNLVVKCAELEKKYKVQFTSIIINNGGKEIELQVTNTHPYIQYLDRVGNVFPRRAVNVNSKEKGVLMYDPGFYTFKVKKISQIERQIKRLSK